jgi:2-polyprenyl-6-methoxyphenol hydroxylase-like FAD-dependent oxidoreductase
MDNDDAIQTVDCCIAGGGPAGVVLGLLLARQGVSVLLLEAHENFDRDFRGDTVHPSTVALLEQIGLLDKLLALPHAAMLDFPFHYPDGSISPPPTERDRARQPHSYQVPQHLLLDMLVGEARRYPTFRVAMGARVDDLLHDGGVVCGVRYTAADGKHEVGASLVVGADGRFSKVRQLARNPLLGHGEPMDVLWFRLPKTASDPKRAAGLYLGAEGQLVVMDRPDGWQVGYVFAKGAYRRLRTAGLEALHRSVVDQAGWLADRIGTLQDWRQTSLLSVDAGRVERWYVPGLLLIGDAAHVMTPVGGVGINYAVQDAVVAANILSPRLLNGTLRTADLASVQRRRELPTRLMQAMQRLMTPFSRDGRPQLGPPFRLRVGMSFPPVAEIRRRLIRYGGWRPERLRDLASQERPGRRAIAAHLATKIARGVWSAMTQIDPRVMMVLGGGIYPYDAAVHDHGTTLQHDRSQRSASQLPARNVS